MIRHTLGNLAMVAAVLITGLLAGLNVGAGLGQYSNLSVSYLAWVPRQQAELALFGHFMPALGNAAILLPVLAAVLVPGSRRWLFALAALLMVGVLIATITAELPLNKVVQGWDPQIAVTGWAATRAAWLSVLWVKTALSLLAFLAATIGLWRHPGSRRNGR